ncbi:hypothetical protein [Halomonas maura]|uniref:hypothetical protein n=1 Tax=Halomonas maura TaxID=117606 RepID=UPI0025B3F483|nr:hypothetical protein [Halomonas maura]MDN3554696.1 hypothetical protein [Halomonas maura]
MAANMIWVMGGIIVGAVFVIDQVYPSVKRDGYDMDDALMLMAVLAWIVLPPIGLRIAVSLGQWIYEGFKDSNSTMSAGLSSQGAVTQIEGGGKAEDYELADIEAAGSRYSSKVQSSELEGKTSPKHWMVGLYERNRKYVHSLPLLLVILGGASGLFLGLGYRHEPGESELLRGLLVTGLLFPPLALIIYVCLVYIYLGYSAFKGRLPKLDLALVFLLPAAGVFSAAATTLHEMAGRFEFGMFAIAAEHDALFDILGESAGRAGLPIAVLHLAIFSLLERKRNPKSMASVLTGWSLVFLVFTGLSYGLNVTGR